MVASEDLFGLGADAGVCGDEAEPCEALYAEAAAAIARSDFLLVVAGAGLSQDSGLPVFQCVSHARWKHFFTPLPRLNRHPV